MCVCVCVCVCMCVCLCVYMCVCVFVCVYLYIYISTSILYTCTYVHMYMAASQVALEDKARQAEARAGDLEGALAQTTAAHQQEAARLLAEKQALMDKADKLSSLLVQQQDVIAALEADKGALASQLAAAAAAAAEADAAGWEREATSLRAQLAEAERTCEELRERQLLAEEVNGRVLGLVSMLISLPYMSGLYVWLICLAYRSTAASWASSRCL